MRERYKNIEPTLVSFKLTLESSQRRPGGRTWRHGLLVGLMMMLGGVAYVGNNQCCAQGAAAAADAASAITQLNALRAWPRAYGLIAT